MVARSVFSNNSTAGIEADPGGQLMLDSSVVGYNGIGISAGGGAVGFANSDIAFNGTAFNGATTTFGNNRIFGNAAPGMAPAPDGAATPALGQQ